MLWNLFRFKFTIAQIDTLIYLQRLTGCLLTVMIVNAVYSRGIMGYMLTHASDSYTIYAEIILSWTLAEKVLFRQVGHVGTTHDRVHHSFAIGRQVGPRDFSARV